MKQVPREDFEVLTKYHPGEIRYYVDTNKVIAKNRGAKVTVRRKPIKDKTGNSKTSHSNRGLHIQLGVKGAGNMSTSSIQYNVYCAATRVLAEDPTKVMLRTDLTKQLESALPSYSKVSQIVPSITSLIKSGRLRYTGAPA
jgi:hypothetical protein